MNPPIQWFGGKANMRKTLLETINLMPGHRTYVEVLEVPGIYSLRKNRHPWKFTTILIAAW